MALLRLLLRLLCFLANYVVSLWRSFATTELVLLSYGYYGGP